MFDGSLYYKVGIIVTSTKAKFVLVVFIFKLRPYRHWFPTSTPISTPVAP
jgi:hypothetical protein